jgi:hypothetical protein
VEELLLELLGLPFVVYGFGILIIVNNEGSSEAIVGGILWMALGTVGIVFWVRRKIRERKKSE